MIYIFGGISNITKIITSSDIKSQAQIPNLLTSAFFNSILTDVNCSRDLCQGRVTWSFLHEKKCHFSRTSHKQEYPLSVYFFGVWLDLCEMLLESYQTLQWLILPQRLAYHKHVWLGRVNFMKNYFLIKQ